MCTLRRAEKAQKGHERVWLWNETSVETTREIRDVLDEIPWGGSVARYYDLDAFVPDVDV